MTNLKARTASKVATQPACTSLMLPLVSKRLISSTKVGHLEGKSKDTTDLRVFASWTAIALLGAAAMRGRMLIRIASRSEGTMTAWSGLREVSRE